MKKAFVIAATSALALALTPACDTSEGVCTLMDCSSTVSADVTALVEAHDAEMPLSVELCFDGDACETFTVDSADGAVLELDIADETYEDGTYDLSVSVKNGSGTELEAAVQSVDVNNHAPNGEDCGPICTQGNTTFDGSGS